MKNEQRPENNDLTNKRNFKYALLLVAFGIVFYTLINHLSIVANAVKWILGLLTPLIVGFGIAYILNIFLSSLERLWEKIFKKAKGHLKNKLKRPVCLTLSFIILLGVVFLVLFMVIPELIRTLSNFSLMLPEYLENLELWWGNILYFFQRHNISLPEFAFDYEKIGTFVSDIVKSYGNSFIDKTVEVTTSVVSTIINIGIAFVFSIYVLTQKEKLCRQSRMITYSVFSQKKGDKIIDFVAFVNQTFTNFFTGQFSEAIILGCLCYIGMKIFRFPFASAISVLVGFTALIPMVGAIISNITGTFLILLVSPVKAFWFCMYLLILQLLENNLIYPKVVGKSVGLSGLLVLTAVTIGGRLFGVLGIVFSVPMLSVIYCVIRNLVYNSQKENK